ncbi:unnamed protein product [Phytophthora fragariaefolia]|uniref:Unnamed protein product n=1 Tax=Phytophthora fragariaefolia TaxID=1490495 RepID=A0A9W6YIL3_9STRA|nr:unnamed protein product [Phytophthora fragariaefolia]
MPRTLTSPGMSRPNSPLGRPPKIPKKQTLSSRVEAPAPRTAHRSVLAGGGRKVRPVLFGRGAAGTRLLFPQLTASSAESAHASSLSTASSLSLALPCGGGRTRALTRRSGAMASWVWLISPVSKMNGEEEEYTTYTPGGYGIEGLG